MNLSPVWFPVLSQQGWHAIHWSDIGSPQAPDHEIMSWARSNDFVVLTHDLDFGALLASSSQSKPSVVQIRVRDILPGAHTAVLCDALGRFSNLLDEGALLIIEPDRERVRILPLEEQKPD